MFIKLQGCSIPQGGMTLKLIQERKFFFVMSLARTWKFEDGHSLKDLVTHIRS
jgi:hypothetical protein